MGTMGWIGAIICTAGVPAVFAGSVIINEYNAVDSGNQLDGGGGSDPYWGTAVGNGGDWFELVAVGDGTAQSTVDMRGWRIVQYEEGGGTLSIEGQIILSNNPYWEMVQAGTILTFHEDDTAGGGLDSHPGLLFGTDVFDSQGWGWKNIFTDDASFVEVTDASHDGGFKLNKDDNVFEIYDASGALIAAAGEGHEAAYGFSPDYVGGGVNDEEVFELQADPNPFITAASNYDDSNNSSFGSPNDFSGGTLQDFSAFVGPNLAPEPSRALLLLLGLSLGLLRRSRGTRS